MNLHEFALRRTQDCGGCGMLLEIGEPAFYPDNNSRLFGVDCCGDLPIVPTYFIREESELDLTVEVARVLPRRAQPMCLKCFQIPSSNGVCGCVG